MRTRPLPARTMACTLAAMLLATPALARNDRVMLDWQDVLGGPEAKTRLAVDVALRFGDGSTPAAAERKEVFQANRIARASDVTLCQQTRRGYSQQACDAASCRAAATEALAELQKRAREVGADAAVEVVSNYQGNAFGSATQVECHAGGTGGHVSIRATLVRLGRP